MSEISPQVVRVLASLRSGETTQVLLERTLGQGLLAKLHGGDTDLPSIYKNLGGNDPGVLAMLDGRVNEEFQRMPVEAGIESTRQAALSGSVQRAAASKSGNAAELAGNPVFTVEGQPLHTLAALGGPEFTQKFNIPVPGPTE